VIKEYGNLPLVECYAGQLNQVFMNLLSNAIDAIDEQNQSLTLEEIQANPSFIRVRTELVNDREIAIRIIDNGPGITEEVKGRLFDPFFTTKSVGTGTGLGLSISYQIVVEKHGGQLHCYSQLGQGTEFVIQIPIQQPIKNS
jgi:signal transduction histidine kinase